MFPQGALHVVAPGWSGTRFELHCHGIQSICQFAWAKRFVEVLIEAGLARHSDVEQRDMWCEGLDRVPRRVAIAQLVDEL